MSVKNRLASGDCAQFPCPIVTYAGFDGRSPADVLIEFRHNDGGSPDSSARVDVYGDDDSVTQTVKLVNGTVEVVHTFG